MASYNRIVMIGNLTRDPEYKQLGSGQPVCRLGLASNRQYRNRQSGDLVQEVCFVDIDVWGPQAEHCKQYLAKGRQVLIEGRLKFDTWQDQESGSTRSKHSIVADRVVFLSSGAAGELTMSDEVSAKTGSDQEQFEPRNDVERELLSQLDGIKTRTQATKSGAAVASRAKKSVDMGSEDENDSFGLGAGLVAGKSKTGAGSEASFKDQPPFKDDLPF